jgi:AcrR family transcriptional regulator
MATTPAVRRKVPRAERERQMLDVADAVFAARGYHAASMDEIAAGVGVTKPMLYSYFGSKEGLYLASVERSGDQLLARFRDAGALDAPGRARLAAGIQAFFAFVDERREGWAVLYREAAAQGGPFAARVAELRSRIASIVARLLAEAAEEGEVDAARLDDPEAFAHAIVGAGESLANWWLGRPEVPREEMAERLLAFAWSGIAEPAAPRA